MHPPSEGTGAALSGRRKEKGQGMAQPALEQAPGRSGDALAWAIARTHAYFALFSYSPTLWELHRYLHGVSATLDEVRRAQGRRRAQRNDALGTALGPAAPTGGNPLGSRRARAYILLLRHLPFVRMLGLTGSRAVAPRSEADIDLMIVATPGRVWLCRLATIMVVRLARLFGDRLCPNYVLSAACLALPDLTIYEAHELAQLVPLYGQDPYHALWQLNPAVRDYLPNASPFPTPSDKLLPGLALTKRLLERLLGGRLGDRLERWEAGRKVARLRREGTDLAEITLTADQCKGHFDGHKARVLAAYVRLLAQLEGA